MPGEEEFNWADWGTYGSGAVITLQLDGGTGTTQFIGPWDQRWSFARKIFDWSLGLAEQFQDDPRATPVPGRDLLPRSVTMKGFPANAPMAHRGFQLWAQYEKAILTVQYSSARAGDPVPGPGNTMISETLSPISDFIGLSPDHFQWADGDSLSDEEAPNLLTNMLEYRLTKHGVRFVHPLVYTLVNHINSKIMHTSTGLLGRRTFEVGTMLFTGSNVQRASNYFDKKIRLNVEMAFKIKRNFNPGSSTVHGHNSYFRVKKQRWETLKVREDVDTLADYAGFPSADLTLL